MLFIKKRTTPQINTIFFTIMSVVFFHVITSLHLGVSALSFKGLWNTFSQQALLPVFFLLSLLLIAVGHKLSRYVLLGLILTILSKIIGLLLEDFNKLILILLFCFLSVAFCFYQIWSSELEGPYFNPLYRKNSFMRLGGRKVMARLSGPTLDQTGYLMNWNESGCFIKFDESSRAFSGIVDLSIHFSGMSFNSQAQVVTRNENGVGLMILDKNAGTIGWNEIFDILEDRGYDPHFS